LQNVQPVSLLKGLAGGVFRFNAEESILKLIGQLGKWVSALICRTPRPSPSHHRASGSAQKTNWLISTNTFRDLVQSILEDTQEHIDFLETQRA
jgi:hypothetical protein